MTESAPRPTLWPVAVFAHNEADHIAQCLDSLFANEVPGVSLQVHVLVNGCSDDTLAVVRRYAAARPAVIAHDIKVGDKANAWNVYLHELAPDSDVHFFIDGDVLACPGALPVLAAALAADPARNAAAALPVSGRSLKSARAAMLAGAELAGNLYALSGSFARRIKQQAIYMPVGFIGEDSLVGAYAKWDLDAVADNWSNERIIACAEAGFAFKSLSAASGADWRLYINRRIRYSIRRIQLSLYRQQIKVTGLANAPRDVRGLYARLDELPPISWQGIDAVFGRLAMRRIRKQMATH